jgi:hypothetical protein
MSPRRWGSTPRRRAPPPLELAPVARRPGIYHGTAVARDPCLTKLELVDKFSRDQRRRPGRPDLDY